MRYSEVLESMKNDGGLWSATVTEDWLQGRSIFGGLQAALAVRAMRAWVPPDLPLRTLQVTFMAPVAAGHVQVLAQVLRTGKSATHVEARIVDADQTLCIAVGIFGAGRPSQISVVPRQSPVAATKPIVFPFIQGITPNFTQHLAVRWLEGSPPFTGNPSPKAVVEVGLRDSGPVGEAQVLAIADFIPPVALSMLKVRAFGSSMTWTIEFLLDRFDALTLQGWRVDAEVVAAGDGYTSQSSMIWGPGGEAVAVSRQNMVVFA